LQWCIRIRDRERERELLDPISFLIELGTKVDYKAVGGSVANFQALIGRVVVGEIWAKPGVCRLEECISM
jgi:hypothetical protein